MTIDKINERKSFGENLRFFRMRSRDANGKMLSQESLAYLLNNEANFYFNRNHISAWERGKSVIRANERDLLLAIVKALVKTGGILSPEDANILLRSGMYMGVTQEETLSISPDWNLLNGEEVTLTSEEFINPIQVASTFGDLLRNYRTKPSIPISQNTLASELSKRTNNRIHRNTIRNWETGEKQISPNDRDVLIELIKILREEDGIASLEEANSLLRAGYYKDLSLNETSLIDSNWIFSKTENDWNYEDGTPFHKDSISSVDHLGRKGFIEALAFWLDRYWDEFQKSDSSFVINLNGVWGIGKSTFMNLLKQELAGDNHKDWLVVWFNAWENQHIEPVWWGIIDKVYSDALAKIESETFINIFLTGRASEEFTSKKKGRKPLGFLINRWKKISLRLFETFRRFFNFSSTRLVGVLFVIFVFSFIFYWATRDGFLSNLHFLKRVGEVVSPIMGLLSLGGVVYGFGVLLYQTLFFGSQNNAEMFLDLVPDPIHRIKHNFDSLTKNIHRPILICIDDLDRCEEDYLVATLESIQTILNNQRVFFIIAADQNWLMKAFETKYSNYIGTINTPGKSIGHNFLEKIFQLTLSIPNMSNEAQISYLKYLLGDKNYSSNKLRKKKEAIEKEFVGITSEEELIRHAQVVSGDPIEDALRKEIAVIQSASKEIERETEHFLLHFSNLMEPNPRAMKRLITFYSVIRSIAIISDIQLINNFSQRIKLTLWIIVKMRWPVLADYLEKNPDKLNAFKNFDTEIDVRKDLLPLCSSLIVQDVMKGHPLGLEIDQVVITRYVKMMSTGDA